MIFPKPERSKESQKEVDNKDAQSDKGSIKEDAKNKWSDHGSRWSEYDTAVSK